MKNKLHFLTNRLLLKVLIMGYISICSLGVTTLKAQVNFTQTLTADFNKGVFNNVVAASDNVYLQNSATDVGSWLTATVLPQTLAGHKTVTWNDRYVYMVGGFNNTSYVNTVYVATIQSGGISGWTALNALPTALRDPAVLIGTNTIYVLGGKNDTQVFNTIYYAAINTDGTIGAWQTSAVTLPVNLWGHTATYMMGAIYVIGGSSSLTENTALNTVYYAKVNALNTLSAFVAGTNLPTACNRHSTVTYNSKLYVLGGYNNSGTKANTVYIATPGLDGSTGAWSTGTNLPVAISNHSSVVTNGLITVMAGAVGATLSNTVYFANADAVSLAWTTSGNVMYDFTKDGSAFTGNGQIYYGGGSNLSGTPIFNCRYANLTLTSNFVNHGVFVSNPFYELGAERVIDSIAFKKAYTAPANLQVTYRTAGSDGIWGNWTSLVTASPITLGITKQYLQYAAILTGSTTFNSTFNEMKLTTQGTQLSGNLNSTLTFTKAASPYWATADISFTAGTHTFQAGTTILFLPETGLSVGQANVICSGTPIDSVKFLSYNSEVGKWDGIYFAPESDVSVSSQFNYTLISNAGFGSNDANLYCNQTNEPLLSNCNINMADGTGIRLETSNLIIQNSKIQNGTGNGLYLYNSNPSLLNSIITNNAGAGVYFSSSTSLPNYTNTTISNNLYAILYPNVNVTLNNPLGTLTLTNNTYNGICLPGGDIENSYRWNSLSFPIIITNNLRVGKYYSTCRLTIEPGNNIKVVAGKNMQIGFNASYPYGGELYAIGGADSLITFTSLNGVAGGWEGLYFYDLSDAYSSTSVMDYCVVEKGNAYNMYIENTYQPSINHCTIRNAVQDGLKFYGAYNSVINSTIVNNGRYPAYFSEVHTFPTLNGNTYLGNGINMIGFSGGSLTENRTLQNDGIGYHILDNILIGRYYEFRRLTIEPGLTLSFANGKGIQVGYSASYPYGGELHAIGKADSIITFTPYSGTAGDWNGIYFHDLSDYSGATNQLKYCIVQKAGAYNVLCENTGSVTLDHCLFANAVTDGLRYNASYGSFTNCTFNNNGRYPVNFLDWTSAPYHKNNTFSGNVVNLMALSGGTYTENRTLLKDNAEYLVLGNITIGKYYTVSRLSVEPGITLNFASGKYIKVGFSDGYPNGGELWSVGKADSTITYKPYTGIAGDWAGIYFESRSNFGGAVSSLKYCNISKGNIFNVLAENTSQPTIQYCNLTQAVGNGLNIVNSSPTVRNSTFNYNTGYGILMDGSSTATIGNTSAYTNNILNNYGAYDLYNNTANNIDARYNFWGTGESTMAMYRVYDKSDNAAKGRIWQWPFEHVPSLLVTTTVMGGTVKYANAGAYPMMNAGLVVKDFANTTINSATANGSGVYALPSMASGSYTMTVTPTVWGGINSTDALGILNHFTQIIPLSGMKLAAADVNFSHSVNGTDALLVMKRYSGQISTFPAGDYLYNYDTVIMNGSNVTGNIEVLCFGDVNASYTPATKSTLSTGLVLEGTLQVESNTEFEFPVRLKAGMQVGAISLGFYYPEQYLEITGAKLANGFSDFSWTAVDGLFKMGWCDRNTLDVNDDEMVVILRMKSKDFSNLNAGIELELFEDCEFADGLATPNDWEIVSIPSINAKSTGINTGYGLVGLSAYPNPLTNKSVVEFSLEKEGNVHISLLNSAGTFVKDLKNTELASGNHKVALDASNLKPGIYLLKIEITSNGQYRSDMIKVVVSN